MLIISQSIHSITNQFVFRCHSGNKPAWVNVCRNLEQDDWVMGHKFDFLNSEEENYLSTLQFRKRRESFLLGRYAAKQACAKILDSNKLSKISIGNGVFSQPLVRFPQMHSVQVTISHSSNFAAALAYPDTLILGIDVEKCENRNQSILERQLTKREFCAIGSVKEEEFFATSLWAVKESLGKALKTGLAIPYELLEASNIVSFRSHIQYEFVNFPQYRALSLIEGGYVCAITYPANTELITDIHDFRNDLRALFA